MLNILSIIFFIFCYFKTTKGTSVCVHIIVKRLHFNVIVFIVCRLMTSYLSFYDSFNKAYYLFNIFSDSLFVFRPNA